MADLKRFLWCAAYLLVAAGFVLLGQLFKHFGITFVDVVADVAAVFCALAALDKAF